MDLALILFIVGIYITLSFLVPFFIKKVSKSFSKIFPLDKKALRELNLLKKQPAIIKKLSRYSSAETIITLLLFLTSIYLIFMFLNYIMGSAFSELKSTFSFKDIVNLILALVLIVSAVGLAAFISRLLLRVLFKITNPKLSTKLFDSFAIAVQKKQLDFQTRYKFDVIKFDNFIIRYSLYVFILTFITVIILN